MLKVECALRVSWARWHGRPWCRIRLLLGAVSRNGGSCVPRYDLGHQGLPFLALRPVAMKCVQHKAPSGQHCLGLRWMAKLSMTVSADAHRAPCVHAKRRHPCIGAGDGAANFLVSARRGLRRRRWRRATRVRRIVMMCTIGAFVSCGHFAANSAAPVLQSQHAENARQDLCRQQIQQTTVDGPGAGSIHPRSYPPSSLSPTLSRQLLLSLF